MKIYTKTGDKGKTSLFGGYRAPKSDAVFDVLGSLDELNSILGFAQTTKVASLKAEVSKIQNDLFEIGSFIAGKKFDTARQKVWESKVQLLETAIDYFESKNTKLQNFILPGGTLTSSYLHQSRAVCRRAERLLIKQLKSSKNTRQKVFAIYLNRLSDLLFVMARFANKQAKVKDTIWKSQDK